MAQCKGLQLPKAVSSNLTLCSKGNIAQLVEQILHTDKVTSSSLVITTSNALLVQRIELESSKLRMAVRFRHGAPSFNAGIAQLVEHLLAKQDVASSSLVSRSKYQLTKCQNECIIHLNKQGG